MNKPISAPIVHGFHETPIPDTIISTQVIVRANGKLPNDSYVPHLEDPKTKVVFHVLLKMTPAKYTLTKKPREVTLSCEYDPAMKVIRHKGWPVKAVNLEAAIKTIDDKIQEFVDGV